MTHDAMRSSVAVVLLILPTAAYSDLADKDPKSLCEALNSFGLEMSKFESTGDGGRPLCYVTDQPTSVAKDGYEYSFRVIAHHTYDHPDKLFLEVSGIDSEVLGQLPHLQFSEMAKVVLSELYREGAVSDILLAIESISPGYNRHMIVDGLGIQLRVHDYTQYGYPGSFSIRFDVSNVCQFRTDSQLRAECIAESIEPIGSLIIGDE